MTIKERFAVAATATGRCGVKLASHGLASMKAAAVGSTIFGTAAIALIIAVEIFDVRASSI